MMSLESRLIALPSWLGPDVERPPLCAQPACPTAWLTWEERRLSRPLALGYRVVYRELRGDQ